MSIRTTYICDICGKKFDNEEDMNKCLKEHSTCICEKAEKKLILKSEYLYEPYGSMFSYFNKVVLNFETGALEYWKYRESAPIKPHGTLLEINYCPICGKKIDKYSKE